ncbi:hypothetical protein BDN71DRAFT_1442351 [Pleurotus eryngii]|uniref:Uncharacterized protein n=1 Tax=Pleurotus eryngii TaxID=5323 RepID=A0A9P6A4U7_PLEER|nr:hypothetical protein BDN71DRAFT_1442351 [Pleurotus eryngii]
MPFFKSATNFEIQNSTFNDIAGNYTANNTTTNRTLTNSNNKRAKTVENSYNDSSMGWNTRDDGAEEIMVRSGRRAPAQRTGRASADHTSFVPSARSNTGSISRLPDRPLNLLQQRLDLNGASQGSESISIPSGGIHSGRTRREDGVTVAQADPRFGSSDVDSTSESTTLSDHQDTDLESEFGAPNAVTAPFASSTHQPQEAQTLEPEAPEENALSPPTSPIIPVQAAAVSPPLTPHPVQLSESAHHRQDDNDENGNHDVGLGAVAAKEKIDDDHEAESVPAPELPKLASTNTNTKPEKKSKIRSFFHMKRPSFRRDSQ